MQESVVRIENLKSKYMSSEDVILKNISLNIKSGEFVGIIGPSGAGKTTLVSLMKALIPHTISGKIAGEIDVFGKSVKEVTPDQLAERVGMVMQDPESQIIGLTVREDLAFGPENFQWPVDKILEKIPNVLRMVRLEGSEYLDTYSLSGGQKQRLSIAGALISEPELLILDEPTSELDPIGRQEVFETIKSLKKKQDFTVIVVEQSVEELIEICDRIIVMKEGRIIADDHPKNLFKQKEIFWGENKGEIPIPQTIELQYMLSDSGIINNEQITPYFESTIQLVKDILIGGHDVR